MTTNSQPAAICSWCERVHDNPVTLDPFSLGALVRSMGREAFEATCETVARRAAGESRWPR